MEKTEDLTLGIDLGTTSVKVVLVRKLDGKIVSIESMPTQANVDVGDSKKSEQSVSKIFQTVNTLLEKLPQRLKEKVVHIGISGQMHGLVMWKRRPCTWLSNGTFQINNQITTNLITWQDKRCSEDFIMSLPDTGKGDIICSGFGLPTLLWLQKHDPELFGRGKHCGTIADLLVAILTGSTEDVKMMDQNASGWGFYNANNMTWKKDLLSQMDFPTDILPKILPANAIAGTLERTWSHVPVGCPIGPAAGDMLASVLSILHSKNDSLNEFSKSAIINISTSIQLAFVLPKSFSIDNIDQRYPAVEYRPYFGGRFLAAGAGLNGGNCLALFVSTLKDWLHKLGLDISEDKVWEVLLREGRQQSQTDLRIEPTLLGERTKPSQMGSISGINPGNLSLGHVMRAACGGIVDTVESLLPRQMLRDNGIHRIYMTGSAIIRNSIIQEEIAKSYRDFDIEMCDSGDAAYGAAIMSNIKPT